MVRNLLLAAVFAALLPAPAQAQGIDVTGHLPDLAFRMFDDHGRSVGAGDYRGRVVWLVFGFAGCGDACPLTLGQLRLAKQTLGPDAGRVQLLFVSVTPQADHPVLLHAWLQGQAPEATGLTGSRISARELARALRAAYPVRPGDAPVHSNAVYVFDAQGHARSLIASAQDQSGLLAATRPLLR